MISVTDYKSDSLSLSIMSGYDLNRFVDLTHTDVSELTCSICQDILRCPVITNCCLQAFCEECINVWLKNNNTCPYDRKELNEIQLSRPPRLLTNMLGKMKIRCINATKGCKEILTVDNLDVHESICPYIKEICDKCKCHLLSDHDCIQSLLDHNQKLIQSSSEMKTENANYFKTIQYLYSNQTNNSNDISSEVEIQKLAQLISMGGIKTDELIVEKTNFDHLSIKALKDIILESIKVSESFEELCIRINISSAESFGGNWNCFVYKKYSANYSAQKFRGKYISLLLFDLKVLLFQTQH